MARGRPPSTRLFAEECPAVDLAQFANVNLERAGTMLDLVATSEDGLRTSHSIKLTTTPQHFGGVRRWMICPGCGRRVRKLYTHVSDRTFACRICRGLPYECQHRRERSAGIHLPILPMQNMECLPVLGTAEVAELLGLTPRMIRYLARKGKIRSSICRGQRRFSLETVRAVLRAREAKMQTQQPPDQE